MGQKQNQKGGDLARKQHSIYAEKVKERRQLRRESLSQNKENKRKNESIMKGYATATAATTTTTTASNDAFSTKPNNDNFAREISVKELKGPCWFFPVA